MTVVLEDLVVPEGAVNTYVESTNNNSLVAALWMGGDGQAIDEPSLINYGEMHLSNPTDFNGVLIYFSSAYFWDDAAFENYGLISAIDKREATAIAAPDWSPDFYNAGSVVASAPIWAACFQTWDNTTKITNTESGSFLAQSNEVAIAIRMANGQGIIIGNGGVGGGALANAGEIVAHSTGNGQTGHYEAAVGVYLGTGGPGDAVSIVNSGLIEATDTDLSTLLSDAILLFGDVGGFILNSGTIHGSDYAIEERSNNQPYTFDIALLNSGLIEGIVKLDEGKDTLLNTGTITGAVDMGQSPDAVLNNGTITGTISLGTANDVYDGSAGVQHGVVFGQDGLDLLIGTAGADSLNGGAGNDILVGSGGDSLTGGSGSDKFVLTGVSFGSAVLVTDFVTGVDMIDLSQLHPTSVTINGSIVTAATSAGSFVVQVGSAVAQSDIITVSATDQFGSAAADALVAGLGASALHGNAGDDLLYGSIFNDLLDGGNGEDTMAGGSGDDFYLVDLGMDTFSSGDMVVELANGGIDTVQSSVSYTLTRNVENLILSGTDLDGTGNELANILVGTSGRNFLYGGGGDDILEGGFGNDTMFGGDGVDTATYSHEIAGVAVSLAIQASQVTGTGIDTLSGIENLTGSAFNDTLTGDANANVIQGGDGDDVIDGGAGLDTASYASATSGITVSLASTTSQITLGAGTDTLSNIENLMGSAFADNLAGDGNANILAGGDGIDTLNGGDGADTLEGGIGADLLIGGTGNDRYIVDQSGDVITEFAGEGEDMAILRASYTLAAGVSVEGMTTVNGSATTAINLTGNDLAQSLYGNAGANILMGMGGADYLAGGAGNDVYYVDPSDSIAESVGGGDDMVVVPTTYILRDGTEIETLVAWNQDSLDPVSLTGNEYGQSLYGSQGVNSLNGGGGNDYLVGLGGNDFLLGGTGDDNMAGGQGNDIYYVEDSSDQIFENAGEGDDIAVCFASFSLRAGQSVETLTAAEGSAAINLTGNALGQSLYGNAGANILTSGGGADYMVGGAGNDVFVLTNAAGVATVGDYAAGDVVDIGQYLSVANGTNVTAGGYVRIVGTQLQVDANGGGDAFVTVGNVSGSGSVTIRYQSGGSPTDLGVARSAGQTEAIVEKTALDAGHALVDHSVDPQFAHDFAVSHDLGGFAPWALHLDSPGIV